MPRISAKMKEEMEAGRVFCSFEYFPPKTDIGVENLYVSTRWQHSNGIGTNDRMLWKFCCTRVCASAVCYGSTAWPSCSRCLLT